MTPDKREQLYDNLIGSGRVSANEIGTKEAFKKAIKDEASARKFHQNLLNSGLFNEQEIGSADDFYGSISSDFSQPSQPSQSSQTNNDDITFVEGDDGQLTPLSEARQASSTPAKEEASEETRKGTKPVAGAAKPTKEDLADAKAQTEEILWKSKQTLRDASNRQQWLSGTRGLQVKPVRLGESSRVVKGDDGNYITESGNEYERRELADLEENTLAQQRSAQYWSTDEGMKRASREQVATLGEDIRQRMNQRGQELDAEAMRSNLGDRPMGGGAMVHTFNSSTVNGRYADREWRALNAAHNAMVDAQRVIDAADANSKNGTFAEWLNQSFMGGAQRGFGEKLFDARTWDMGLSEGVDAEALADALHAADSGEELTDAQRMLLDAKAVELATNAYFGSYVGKGYKAGQVTGESIPFMIEMCLNPASKTGETLQSALARYAIKRFAKKAAGEAAEKLTEFGLRRAVIGAGKGGMVRAAGIVGRGVGDLAGASAMTATSGIVGTTADAISRTNGDVRFTPSNGHVLFNGHEDGDDFSTAFRKAFAGRTIENYSEMFGEYFSPLLGVVGKGASKVMDKLGLGVVKDFMENVATSDVARLIADFEKNAKWNGVFGEYAEEVAGGIMNALVVGDQTLDTNPDTGVFNLDNNIDTFLGVSLMGGFMSAMKTVGYRTPKYRARKDMTAKDDAAASAFGNQETWGGIRNTIAFGEDADVRDKLKEVLTNPDYSPEQRAAVLEYAKAVETYRGMLRGEEKRRADRETDPTQTDLETSFDNGYSLSGFQEMNDARNMYEYQRRRIGDFATDDMLAQLDAEPVGALNAIRMSESWTDEEKQTAIDYVNAKATYDGMIAHVQDDIESRVNASDAMIAGRQHKEDGMIHPATMKTDDRKVYVVGGNIVMSDDGTMVDREKSDESIVIRDANTGNLEFADPREVLTVDEAIDAEQEKQAARDVIRQEYAQAAADKIDGVLPFNEGDSYQVMDEQGVEHTVTVVAPAEGPGVNGANGQNVTAGDGEVLVSFDGGEAVPISKEVIQNMANSANLARLQQFEQEKEARRAADAAAEREANRPVYNINDEVTLQTEAGTVRGSITAEANEDGQYEVYTEEPINGKKINLFTRDELDSMLIEHNGNVAPEAQPTGNESAVLPQGTTENGAGLDNAGGEAGAANGTGANNPPAAAPSTPAADATDTVVEPMPMIGEGEDAEPDFLGVAPARAHTYIYKEAGLSREEADQFIEANKKAADKELKKAQEKAPKIGTSLAKYRKEQTEWQAKVDAAQQKADYWQAVKDEQQKVLDAEAQERAVRDAAVREQAVIDEQARQAEELRKREEQARLGSNNVAAQITERWEAAPKVEGARNEIVLANGERVPGRYVLVESGAATPSHNARAEFAKNEGFPLDDNGQSVNDRDYERDKDAQSTTRQIASVYDQRALQTPVVVSRDGVVLSGNGRTMAGELAADAGTDGAYIEHLKKYGQQFGFTPEQVESMQHPRVLFVPDEAMPYTAETYAKFNAQEMKGQSKTEQAVKLGKVVDDNTFGRIIRSINSFDTLGEFYNDPKAATEAINELRNSGAISQAQYTEMFDGDGISAQGREVLENMLIGKAFESNPDAVRQITAFKGVRQSVITALAEISNNIMLGKEYSLESELAQAIDLVYQARQNGYKAGDAVSGFARQGNLFQFDEGATVADYTNATVLMLADVLNDNRTTLLKKTLTLYNKAAKDSANGQLDIFSGDVRSQDDILNEVRQLLQYGTEAEQQAAIATATEERVAAAQEDGTAGRGSEVSAAVAAAESDVDTNPTEAQKEAGNYKKGHVRIDGFDVTIENPKGSERSGRDASGREWRQVMNNTYGYIRGTEGVDGDHIDVFLSDNPESGNVYVIDQRNADGSFDEHKVMYGFNSADEARAAYLSNYKEGWQGLGAITEVSKDEFKKWVNSSHRKTKPFAEYKSVKKAAQVAQHTGQRQEATELRDGGNAFDFDEIEELKKASRSVRSTIKDYAIQAYLTAYLRVPAFQFGVPTGERIEMTYEKFLDEFKEQAGVLAERCEEFLPVVYQYIESKLERQEAQGKPAANATGTVTDGEKPYTITPTTYINKKGKETPMFLVKFGSDLTKEQIRAGKELARESKGWWDREQGGFMMRSEDAANELAEALSNEDAVADAQPMSLQDMAAATEQLPTEQDTNDDDRALELFNSINEGDVLVNDTGMTATILKKANGGNATNQAISVKWEQSVENGTNGHAQKIMNAANFLKWYEANKMRKQGEVAEKQQQKRLVSDERMEELKARLRKKLGGQMNMGVDPEILAIGAELAVGHIERGLTKFADYAKTMIEDLGDAIRPYLKAFYNAVRDMPEAEEYAEQMDSYEDVRKFDLLSVRPEGETSDTTAGILERAEEVAKEQEAEEQAEVAKGKLTEQRNDGRKVQSEGVALDGTPLRAITEKDLDNRDAKFYHQGKRVYIMAVMRSGEQVSATQFSEPNLDKIYLTNGQSIKPEELMVADETKEPVGNDDVQKILDIAKKGKKTSKSKKKSVSLQQEPDLFGSFGEEASDVESSNSSNNDEGRENRPSSDGVSTREPERSGRADNSRLDGHIQESGNEREGNRGVSPAATGERSGSGRPAGSVQELETSLEVPGGGESAHAPARPGGRTIGVTSAHADRPFIPKNTHNNHAERGKDYAPKGVDARIEANIKAIELMQQLMESGEQATPEQMAVLRQFSGWGGLGKAFSSDGLNGVNGRLRQLLGEEAYEQANMSRNSAYYTPASVIDALWDIARAMGFKGGRVLEGSAGIGNILGLMPTDMSERSDIHAVEIDQTTGNILSLLYPDAKVDVQGFEATEVENGSVDLAITNVPFVTGLRVNDTTGDKDLSKKFHDIHDFCIAKNVRKLREGGIGIFITSSGTLDNSARLREWIVQEGGADVVGAFRLNNETFGGTGATSDIIVIRKRVNGKKSPHAIDVLSTTGERTAEYDTGEYKRVKGEEVPVVKKLSMDYNSYFVEHPEMMGGEMHFGFEMGETFRPTSKALYPVKGKNQAEMLKSWSQSFEGKDWGEAASATQHSERENIYEELGEDVKEGSMVVSNGQLCVAQRGKAVPLAVNANKVKGHSKVECFEAYQGIKKALSDLLQYQTDVEDDSGLQPLLKALNKAYDDFVKTYGHLHKNTSISFLKNDVDFPNILALEKFSERGDVKTGKRIQEFGKTDVFSRRVVEKEKMPEPKNVKDAIIASIYVHGRIDIPWMAATLSQHTGHAMTEEEIKAEIVKSGLGFENPVTRQMEVSYEYLSGNVREKLAQAQANNSDGRYDANIKALESVIPMNIPAHLIDFNIGSSWIEPKLYAEYVKEKTDVDVSFTSAAGTWIMKTPHFVGEQKNRAMGVVSQLLQKTIMGTTLIEAAMQNKTITVSETHKNWDGTTETVTDKEATLACGNKIDEIRQDFRDWMRAKMQSDAALSEQMERTYNNIFNNYAPRVIPDEFVPAHFGGAATVVDGRPFSLRPHQGKAVVRGTMQPLLLAHEVGTGKTYTLISTAMEMRRLGTARKPMIVVQNATVGQFVESAKKLYPNAKVLTLEERDHTREGRRNFYAKIKYNDWDMIVVPQSVFERIPDSEERQMQFVQDKIEEKMMALEQMQQDLDNDNPIVRQAEREIDKLQEELADLTDAVRSKRDERDEKKEAVKRQNAEVRALEMLDRETDDVENFDDMGIDALLVDEAHEYKHLGFATAMQRGVKGVDPSYSKKAQGVYLKTQAVMEKNNGRNVVFATGTPISNTAAEIWTFMRYLMPADTMKEYGIYYFDDFVRNFGNLQQMLEFTTSGKFKENNRFAGYVNLPELVRIWSGVADTVLTREAGGVNDKIPDMDSGKAIDIYLPQTRALRSVMKFVKKELERFDNMTGKQKKENSHIPLTMYGIAKAAAVDARLVVSDAADEPQSKTNEAVRQTLKSLDETKAYKGTVAIFADNYQNKRSGFNLYENIREKLIAAGVPAEQIVVMKSGMSVKKKLEIFEQVNRGEVRVILGSTFTLGTGVNIQERLHTLIHLDAPNRPMDYTQRNGRILRQGNLHKEMGKPVRVLRFGVEDSLDVTAYQRLKTKGAIADSIMNGKQMMSNSMENRALEEEEDVFGDTVAQLSGSEYAMLKNQAEKDVRKYEAKRKQWEADQVYCHHEIPRLEKEIKRLQGRLEQDRRNLDLVAATASQHSGLAIGVGKEMFKTVEGMADFIKDYNKKMKEVENDLRDNPTVQSQRRTLTVNVGGIDFVINTEISAETKQEQGTLFSAVHRKMTYDCEALGLSGVPVRQSLLREALEDIVGNVMSGNDFREDIERCERLIAKHERSLAQVRERDGKPFEFDKELEQAHQRYDEYAELMKKELEEKEKKYAEMDAGVEDIDDISEAEEAEEEEEDEDVRFRDDEGDVFFSNAERAVLDIKQEKATPEQWLKMIEKAGGLKAGEDKWMGLSDWLNGIGRDNDAAKKTLTKEEVLDFIRSNQIRIEEVTYGNALFSPNSKRNLESEIERGRENGKSVEDVLRAWDKEFDARLLEAYRKGEFSVENGVVITDTPLMKPINSTRLNYTTSGLENKREIALVVPTVESWNESDEIHFGDAGEGRAVAWVRFGETTDADGKRVLVIDEIQSKRHQEGREKGYSKYTFDDEVKAREDFNSERARLCEKYNIPLNPQKESIGKIGKVATQEEKDNLQALYDRWSDIAEENNKDTIPDAPFEKNWHELAMKRMLRYAAENGFDKVAWTTGAQQAERYNIGQAVEQVIWENTEDGKKITIDAKNTSAGQAYEFVVDGDGRIVRNLTRYNLHESELVGKPLSDLVGKELAAKIMSDDGDEVKLPRFSYYRLSGDGLYIGGEGMKGFYDEMLPRFMNKYGKKWGVKVGEVELPRLEESARRMWSVDVTDDMRDSVVQGQPLFRGENEATKRLTDEESLAMSRRAGYTKRQHDARTARRMRGEVERVVELLGLGDRVSILEDGRGLKGRKARAKGWFDVKTGKIVIVLGNHGSVGDVVKTILHEGVAHYGLRAMFGKRFDQFLDNVYQYADEDVRARIVELAKKHNWDFREATEEYLARLAEDMDFERAQASGWWSNIKTFFLKMMHELGLSSYGGSISDNELRYILWSSYENLKEPGAYRNLFADAEDISKQMELKVGRFGDGGAGLSDSYGYAGAAVAEGKSAADDAQGGERFRDDEDDSSDESDGGDEMPSVDAGEETLEEVIIRSTARLAREHKDSLQMRINAMHSIGGNLSKLRKAMSYQRSYDRETVNAIVRQAKMLMDTLGIDKMTRGEVKKLLGLINGSAGKDDIMSSANSVLDLMIQHQLRSLADILHKQMSIRGSKLNGSGVEVQGRLDADGKRMLDAMNDGMSISADAIDERISGCLDKMGGTDEVAAKEASVEYQGYLLAKQWHDDIKSSEEEESDLLHELKESRGSVKAGTMDRRSYREFVSATEDAIRENRLQRMDSYYRLLSNLGDGLASSIARAKAFREREVERVREIQHNANSDLQGVACDEHSRPTWTQKAANWSFVRFYMKPLATFNKMLRLFGRRSVNGEGYLWNRFMGGYTLASDREWRNLRAAHKVLDQKVSEVFGRKMKWSDLFAVERKLPGMTAEFWDGGERKSHELSQGNLLYIYMVNKMSDGKMKLRKMGISEEDVDAIKLHLDPRFVELADWLQDHFLKDKRREYNEVHERLFGVSMAAIENYFPLVINSRSRGKEEEIGEPDNGDAKPATITGSIIKRKKNSLALDVTGADAFDVVLGHLQQMEHWAAFAELNRDMNTLLSYKKFRNRVLNMSTLEFGGGETLWKNFKDVCSIAAGVYHPQVSKNSLDTAVVNVAKGVTQAKIAFRIFTALKQLLSYPAYLSEANIIELAKTTNPLGAWKAWNWAMEELPGFSKRWQSRQSGDNRLKESDVDWRFWKNRFVETLGRLGMTPNAFIDGLTVAMGSKAIYETKLKQFLRDGYSEEKAKEKALLAAAVSYNETQQSSENAYLSAMQLDRTVASVALTVFRNASMGYQRRLMGALRNLKRKLTPGYMDESIAFMSKQMVRDGLSEEQAARAAKRAYYRSWYGDLADVALFGFVMQLAWNLGPYIPYLLMGDDDDEKDAMLEDAVLHATAGSVEGLSGGNVMSELYNMSRKGENLSNYNMSLLPALSDIQTMLRHYKSDKVAAASDFVNLLVQSGIGVNPQTITDAYVAIMDYSGGDESTSREFALLLMRLSQVPQSQIDKFYIDELGLHGRELQGKDVTELAERYARYKRLRGAGLLGWAYSDEEEMRAENRYLRKFDELRKDRMKSGGDPEVKAIIDAYKDGEYKEQKALRENLRLRYGSDLDAYESVMSDLANSPEEKRRKAYDSYVRKRSNLLKAGKYDELGELESDLAKLLSGQTSEDSAGE